LGTWERKESAGRKGECGEMVSALEKKRGRICAILPSSLNRRKEDESRKKNRENVFFFVLLGWVLGKK